MRKLLLEVPLLEAVARRCSVKRVFLEILQKFTGKQCARVSVLIKLQASACNFIKKETLTRCFLVNFAKFLRKPLVTEHLRWLLLQHRCFTVTPAKYLRTSILMNICERLLLATGGRRFIFFVFLSYS